MEDLRWLGLDWDEGPDIGGPHGPYRQSERTDRYEAAIAELERRRLVYLCDCSRTEIARIASAPHPGEEGPRYSGLCRRWGLGKRSFKRPPALRLRVPGGRVAVSERLQGAISEDVADVVGDFVLRRGDGVFAYQLAVVVDDLAMGITEVVRGADLLSSAPRQVLLAELLGAQPRAFAHHPMIVAPDGLRWAKRSHSQSIRACREASIGPARVIGALARALGLAQGTCEPFEAMPQELVQAFSEACLAGKRSVRLAPFAPAPDRNPTSS